MSTQAPKKRGCVGTIFRWALYLICGLLMGVALIVFFGDTPKGPSSPTPTETDTVQPTNTPAVSATPTAGPTPTFEQGISSALGERNRPVQPPITVRNESGVVIVEWAISDNLSASMIKTGAMMDVVDILRSIHESDVEYQLISLTGTFVLIDKFGNSSESPVMWLDMSKETMDKINWTDKTFIDHSLRGRLPDIADRLKYHPAMNE